MSALSPTANDFAKGYKTFSTSGGIRVGAHSMARTAVVALLSGASMAAARIALTDCDPERGKVVDGQCLLWDAPCELAADVISFACPSAARRRFSGEISVQDRKLIGALGLQSAKAVSLCAEMLELNWDQVTKVAQGLEYDLRNHYNGAPPLTYLLPVPKHPGSRRFPGRVKLKGRRLGSIENQPAAERDAWRSAIHEAGHIAAGIWTGSEMVSARIFEEDSNNRGLRGRAMDYPGKQTALSHHRAAVFGYGGAIAEIFEAEPINRGYELRWFMPFVEEALSFSDQCKIPKDKSKSWKAASDCLRLLRKNWMSVELIASALIQEMVRHRPALMPPIQFLPVSF